MNTSLFYQHACLYVSNAFIFFLQYIQKSFLNCFFKFFRHSPNHQSQIYLFEKKKKSKNSYLFVLIKIFNNTVDRQELIRDLIKSKSTNEI